MEINYDIIIKHLCGKYTKSHNKENNKDTNTFQTQKNIYTYATTFPNVFKELFSDKFYRYGITTHDNEHNNISFWSSILTVLDKNFLIPYSSDEISLINQFKTQLINLLDKNKLSDFIKKLDKNDMRERFKLNPDIMVIQYVADILDINLWIFDFKCEKINVVYPKDIMNPWKQSVLLANYDIYWEPIMCLKSKGHVTRLFDYNNQVFKKILYLDNVTYLESKSIGKEYIYIDNILDVIKQEKQKLKINVKELLIESEDETEVNMADAIGEDTDEEVEEEPKAEVDEAEDDESLPLDMAEQQDDSDDEEEESYLQKFDSEINKNYILDYHPECEIHTQVEIMAMAVHIDVILIKI
jgi:hypothetical protein